VDAMIRQAIGTKRIVEFMYKGYPRIVELHIYGRKSGVSQVLAYQIGGGSSRGGLPEWRRFDLPAMHNLQVCDESFPGAREYHSGHSAWDETYLIVAP